MIHIRHITIGTLAILAAAIYLNGLVHQTVPVDISRTLPKETPNADAYGLAPDEAATSRFARAELANPVPDSMASETPGYPAQTVSIRGWLGNKLGQGLGGFRIHIRPTLRLAGLQDVYSVTSDARGDFQFDGISTDMTYRLDVEASQYYAGYTLDPLPVNPDRPLTKIVLESIKLIDVDGMIVDADNAPVADFEIFVKNLTVDFPGRWIKSDASGYFRLESFPAGKLQLYTPPPDIYKIEELTLRDDEYRNLRLAIDRGNYYLHGWVSDENGAPLGEANVTLNSVFDRNEYHSSSYRSVRTDSNGGFSFSHLGGQDHQLSVDAAGYQSMELSHRFRSFSDTLRIQLLR